MVLPRSAGRVVGLFAGIGGVEVGLSKAGFGTVMLCENDPAAAAVLTDRFPGVPLHDDVRTLDAVPACDVLAGGFPCQDLSQAGRTAGIGGRRSGLVGHMFRLLERHDPRWVVMENVPFMLSLDRGRAMAFLVERLTELGYAWAYRVVDTRAFGLPQRRQRVIVVASRTEAPWDVLFADEAGPPDPPSPAGRACGFYWTEGVRGLGWAVDAVPTLKGGSTIGIPSPPAIWLPGGGIVTPDIRDAERMQGFRANWTIAAAHGERPRAAGARWKLVGNAVSTPVFGWLGERLAAPGTYGGGDDHSFDRDGRWPNAAWGHGSDVRVALRSMWPRRVPPQPLTEFLRFAPKPLSPRATAGFLRRARSGTLRFPPGFLAAVEAHGDAVAHASGAAP